MVQNTVREVMTETAHFKGGFWGLMCDLGILSHHTSKGISFKLKLELYPV